MKPSYLLPDKRKDKFSFLAHIAFVYAYIIPKKNFERQMVYPDFKEYAFEITYNHIKAKPDIVAETLLNIISKKTTVAGIPSPMLSAYFGLCLISYIAHRYVHTNNPYIYTKKTFTDQDFLDFNNIDTPIQTLKNALGIDYPSFIKRLRKPKPNQIPAHKKNEEIKHINKYTNGDFSLPRPCRTAHESILNINAYHKHTNGLCPINGRFQLR